MPDGNPALWSGQSSAPLARSVLRKRWFWRQFYRLDQEWDLDAFGEIYQFDFWVPASDQQLGRFLTVTSAPEETLLLLTAPSLPVHAEIGRLDEAATEPNTFRWSEVEVLSRFFVSRKASPTEPSVALLLLSAFVGSVDDDKAAMTQVLGAELEKLGLLTAAEVADVIGHRLVETYGGRSYGRIWWEPDPVVGWRLAGSARDAKYAGIPPGYSQRSPKSGGFPAREFLSLLRDVGVRDL